MIRVLYYRSSFNEAIYSAKLTFCWPYLWSFFAVQLATLNILAQYSPKKTTPKNLKIACGVIRQLLCKQNPQATVSVYLFLLISFSRPLGNNPTRTLCTCYPYYKLNPYTIAEAVASYVLNIFYKSPYFVPSRHYPI